ncbi:response regulator receiver protein [Thermobaculum terrenum ATCC BAA-798]|uniref:Response regulator receiver protein n=2 Tax=Thermobaculum TaxID=262406 RepID=D1CGX5_THET1|nr:response regulator receiver protein [Thermobaculum terrenum ATCC BAA-798]
MTWSKAGSPRYHNILIVEDEAPFRKILARNLSKHGLRVLEADTVAAALRTIESENPDLLLLDIHLPDDTGWELLRVLQRRGVEIPTIVVTAVRVPEARRREFQPLAMLIKPFPLDALLHHILGEEVSNG